MHWRCGFYLSSSFFPRLYSFARLFSAVADWTSTIYFHTWCGLSVNLECRSGMCCTRLAGNTWRKNSPQIRLSQLCRAMSSQLKHVSTVRKKLVKQQHLFHMSSQYGEGELQPTNHWDQLAVLGHPVQEISISFASWLRYCKDVAQWRSTKSCMMFGRLLGWYTTYTYSGTLAF